MRTAQELVPPDTKEQLKELHVKHLSDLNASSGGKSVFAFKS